MRAGSVLKSGHILERMAPTPEASRAGLTAPDACWFLWIVADAFRFSSVRPLPGRGVKDGQDSSHAKDQETELT